ncbi:MAG: hypothetical protein P1P84_21150 [Deferrisomatales bacterium]|nr:hypothetical protein [Deferrisomatales bacterium]
MSRRRPRATLGFVLWLLMGSLVGTAGSPAAAAVPADLGQIEPAAVHQNRGAWVVLDAHPKARWQESHLPGARSFGWEDYTGTDTEGIAYRVLPPKELAGALARADLGERPSVVVYGDAESRRGSGEGWARSVRGEGSLQPGGRRAMDPSPGANQSRHVATRAGFP